jgi:uncharacterized membrane protein AbrB (regulator of aidB expression)
MRLLLLILIAAVACWVTAAIVVFLAPYVVGAIVFVFVVSLVAGLTQKLPTSEKKGLQPPES